MKEFKYIKKKMFDEKRDVMLEDIEINDDLKDVTKCERLVRE